MATITEIHKRTNDDGKKLIISKEGIIAMSVVSRIGINTSIIYIWGGKPTISRNSITLAISTKIFTNIYK